MEAKKIGRMRRCNHIFFYKFNRNADAPLWLKSLNLTLARWSFTLRSFTLRWSRLALNRFCSVSLTTNEYSWFRHSSKASSQKWLDSFRWDGVHLRTQFTTHKWSRRHKGEIICDISLVSSSQSLFHNVLFFNTSRYHSLHLRPVLDNPQYRNTIYSPRPSISASPSCTFINCSFIYKQRM